MLKHRSRRHKHRSTKDRLEDLQEDLRRYDIAIRQESDVTGLSGEAWLQDHMLTRNMLIMAESIATTSRPPLPPPRKNKDPKEQRGLLLDWCHQRLGDQKKYQQRKKAPLEHEASLPNIPKRIATAFKSYQWLGEQQPGLLPPDSNEKRYTEIMYLHVKNNCPVYSDGDCPTFETWTRYIRECERLAGIPKNTSRALRTGRSIVGLRES